MKLTNSVAGALVVTALLSSGVAHADTFLSYWENNTTCGYLITDNAPATVAFLQSGDRFDFGPFPQPDASPRVGRVALAAHEMCDGPGPFTVSYQGINPDAACRPGDIGPFRYSVMLDRGAAGPQTAAFCYCVGWGRFAYVGVALAPDDGRRFPINLLHGAGTYPCRR